MKDSSHADDKLDAPDPRAAGNRIAAIEARVSLLSELVAIVAALTAQVPGAHVIGARVAALKAKIDAP